MGIPDDAAEALEKPGPARRCALTLRDASRAPAARRAPGGNARPLDAAVKLKEKVPFDPVISFNKYAARACSGRSTYPRPKSLTWAPTTSMLYFAVQDRFWLFTVWTAAHDYVNYAEMITEFQFWPHLEFLRPVDLQQNRHMDQEHLK